MQVLSIIASLVTMACVAGNYQRFESQHIVGSRQYPWSSRQQIVWRRQRLLKRTEPLPPAVRSSGYIVVPASEHVLRRFAAATSTASPLMSPPSSSVATKSLHLGEFNLDESDSSADENHDNRKILSFLRQRSVESNQDTVDMDFTPRAEAPPPPRFAIVPPIELGLPTIMNRMSTYKDMMLLRTELYLRDNVPRLSQNFHLKPTTKATTDHVDHNTATTVIDDDQPSVLPTRRQLIDGLEQDDFLGKAVSTAAWSLVLMQRMLALSAFAYFHPLGCLILCTGHYLLMLAALLAETRLHTKAERVMFYLFLAYVYIFCIVELKVKFRRPRRTLIAYAVLLMVQNVSMSAWWFGRREYGRLAAGLDTEEAVSLAAAEVSASSTWWFGFMFAAVLLSGVYAVLCWVVYYFLLKPSARVLFAAEQEKKLVAAAVPTEDGTRV